MSLKKEILNRYSSEYENSIFFMSENNYEVKPLEFLNTYLLVDQEKENFWYKKLYSIIKKERVFPEYIFQSDYVPSVINVGGNLFTREDFNSYKKIFQECGDNFFALFVHSDLDNLLLSSDPIFIFPTDISYEELMSGGYISYVLFSMPYNIYNIIPSSFKWIRYVNNDFYIPNTNTPSVDIFAKKINEDCVNQSILKTLEYDKELVKAFIPNYELSK